MKTPCSRCQSEADPYHVFTPFPNPQKKTDFDPVWAFHIKNICADCHQYIGFAKQTPELMEALKGSTFVKLDLGLRPS